MVGLTLIIPDIELPQIISQILIESINILRNVERKIVGIPTLVDFKVINLVERMLSYPTLVIRPWG
jgi:hypothetical protein